MQRADPRFQDLFHFVLAFECADGGSLVFLFANVTDGPVSLVFVVGSHRAGETSLLPVVMACRAAVDLVDNVQGITLIDCTRSIQIADSVGVAAVSLSEDIKSEQSRGEEQP